MKSLFRPSLLLSIVVLALLPLALPNSYTFDVAVRVGLAAITAIGLNLLMGFAGQVSIGHAAFVAIGAYASGVLVMHNGWNPLAAMLAAAAGTGVLAWLIAKPILKLKGHSLTMATLGLGIIVNMVLINQVNLTSGPDGMAVDPLRIGSWVVQGEHTWYWLTAVLLLLALAMSLNLYDSPAGRALRAVDGSEVAARVMGVDVGAFKTKVFVASAVFASVAGSLTAHYTGFITPNLSSFLGSVEFATMVVVGGMASTYGAVFGAALMIVLPQLLGGLEGYEMLFFGLILMLSMIFLPKGIVPTIALRFKKGK